MPQADKSKYTDKQKRKADHIERATRSEGFRRMRRSVALGQR